MSRKDKPLQPLSSNAVTAKELARSLGLVKKRPSSSASRSKGQEKEIKSSQYFAYLIVLDFESTCWKDKKMNYGPEIIEFPAVLLNTSTGQLESEFQMFVQPNEHRKLSEFCTELTGINQTQVDEGVPVGTCLMLFRRWLQEMKDKKGFKFPCDQLQNNDQEECTKHWCTFVTWSDWDLGTCLKNECFRKQLRMPHPLRSWIDLRATYKNFYSRKPQGLAGALQDLGITFSGREHSGLDDARNTARLAWRMMSDGCIMQITKSIDGMVEKLWNIVTKSGQSQSTCDSLGENGTGAAITNSNNQDFFVPKEKPAVHTKHQVVPSKTEGTNKKKILNFNRAVKHDITGSGIDRPCNKMTKIKEKDLVLRMKQNGDENSNKNSQIVADLKRRASQSAGSSAIADVSVLVCAAACDMPNSTTKCLITPATSLSNLNERARGCCAGEFRNETPKSSSTGFLLKRGLVKQTLSYKQHTPLGSQNRHISLETANQPCKASNIEPQAVTMSLFRLLTNQSLLADRQPIEGPNKANSIAHASVAPRNISQTANKLAARATAVTAKAYPMCLNKPCTTPVGENNPFTPPPVANTKKKSPVTPHIACFNGGGVTPPLCDCGRRTRRRSVINPGPNQGRAFFTCCLNHGRSSLGSNADKKKCKRGCHFFRWEVHL